MHANVRGHRFDPVVPRYLEQTYWWAYGHPLAVRVFERQWLINLILWGNFRRLRDAAIAALGGRLEGRTVQISCVYGDLTRRIAARLARGAQLHVIDVLHIQLENLARKLPRRLLERRGPNGRIRRLSNSSRPTVRRLSSAPAVTIARCFSSFYTSNPRKCGAGRSRRRCASSSRAAGS